MSQIYRCSWKPSKVASVHAGVRSAMKQGMHFCKLYAMNAPLSILIALNLMQERHQVVGKAHLPGRLKLAENHFQL